MNNRSRMVKHLARLFFRGRSCPLRGPFRSEGRIAPSRCALASLRRVRTAPVAAHTSNRPGGSAGYASCATAVPASMPSASPLVACWTVPTLARAAHSARRCAAGPVFDPRSVPAASKSRRAAPGDTPGAPSQVPVMLATAPTVADATARQPPQPGIEARSGPGRDPIRRHPASPTLPTAPTGIHLSLMACSTGSQPPHLGRSALSDGSQTAIGLSEPRPAPIRRCSALQPTPAAALAPPSRPAGGLPTGSSTAPATAQGPPAGTPAPSVSSRRGAGRGDPLPRARRVNSEMVPSTESEIEIEKMVGRAAAEANRGNGTRRDSDSGGAETGRLPTGGSTIDVTAYGQVYHASHCVCVDKPDHSR